MWSTQTLETRQALLSLNNMTSSSAWPCAPWKTKRDLASLASVSWRIQLPKCSSQDSHLHQEASNTKSTRRNLQAITITSSKPGRRLSSSMALEEICRNGRSTSFGSADGLKAIKTSLPSNYKTRLDKAQRSWVKKGMLSKKLQWETIKWQKSPFTRRTRSTWEASKLISNLVTLCSSDLLMEYQWEWSTSNQVITSLAWLL